MSDTTTGTGGEFNIGSDSTLTIIAAGSPIILTRLIRFEPRQMVARLDSVKMNGHNSFRDVERGWEGSMEFDRDDSVIDDFFAAKEAARYQGLQPPRISVLQTIVNVDTSVVKYRFPGLTMSLDSAGRWQGDGKVSYRVSWRNGRRIKVQ